MAKQNSSYVYNELESCPSFALLLVRVKDENIDFLNWNANICNENVQKEITKIDMVESKYTNDITSISIIFEIESINDDYSFDRIMFYNEDKKVNMEIGNISFNYIDSSRISGVSVSSYMKNYQYDTKYELDIINKSGKDIEISYLSIAGKRVDINEMVYDGKNYKIFYDLASVIEQYNDSFFFDYYGIVEIIADDKTYYYTDLLHFHLPYIDREVAIKIIESNYMLEVVTC